MTALLELKQKIKGFYAQYELYLRPFLKFILALIYFYWINTNMGYMAALNSVFVILILALICSILPSGMTIFLGCVLMIGHSYALGIETAGFMVVLLLLMLILFLRFSSGKNIVLVFTPLAFGFDVPALLPIGCGLLSNGISALPAAGGVIVYYYVRFLHAQSQTLLSGDMDTMSKITFLADGFMKNSEMWLTVICFVVVILAVHLIRTRVFDYAWRIAIAIGGVLYIVLMLIGSMSMGVTLSITPLIIYTVIAVLVGLVLEFFVFGGDYSRTERLEYEDDEYYYYVKAVPKAVVSTSERSIKKINAEPARESHKPSKETSKKENNKTVKESRKPIEKAASAPKKESKEKKDNFETVEIEKPSVVDNVDLDDIDFEKKLEESLKDL